MKRTLKVLLTAGLLAGGPQAARAEAPAQGEEQQARDLFVQGRHLDAATAYEVLWARLPEPRYLFNAAMAREISGHELQAFVHLQRYLQFPELNSEERVEAEERLQALKARTKQLRIIIAPANMNPNTLALTLQRSPDGSASDKGRTAVDLDGVIMSRIAVSGFDGAFDVALEPGTWTVDVKADGYGPQRMVIATIPDKRTTEIVVKCSPDVGQPTMVPVRVSFGPLRAVSAGIEVTVDGPTPIRERIVGASHLWHLMPGNYELEAKAPRFRPKRVSFVADSQAPVLVELKTEPRRPTPIVLGALAGAGIVTGTAVFASYEARLRPAVDNLLVADIVASRDPSRHGIRTFGAGVGLGVGAITSTFQRRFRHSSRVPIVEAVAGVGLAALGFGLSRKYLQDFNLAAGAKYCESTDDEALCTPERISGFPENPENPMNPLRRGEAANFFGGVGVGLMVSSVVKLVDFFIEKRISTRTISVAPTGGTLTVRF